MKGHGRSAARAGTRRNAEQTIEERSLLWQSFGCSCLLLALLRENKWVPQLFLCFCCLNRFGQPLPAFFMTTEPQWHQYVCRWLHCALVSLFFYLGIFLCDCMIPKSLLMQCVHFVCLQQKLPMTINKGLTNFSPKCVFKIRKMFTTSLLHSLFTVVCRRGQLV